jgi:hypothetical protein
MFPMKITNAILSIIFILFAAVQYNDPDPLMWMVIYGMVAVVCAFAIIHKYNKYVLIVGIATCLMGTLYYFPGVMELFREHEIADLTRKMKADQPFIEKSRESLGLLLAAIVLLFQYRQMRKYIAGRKAA